MFVLSVCGKALEQGAAGRRHWELPHVGQGPFQAAPGLTLHSPSWVTHSHSGGTSECAWKRVGGTGGETALQMWRPEGEKQGGAAGTEQSLQPGEGVLVQQILPLKPMRDHGGVDIHPAALGASHRCSEGSWSLQELEPMERSRFSGRTHTRALQSWRISALGESPHWRGLWRMVSPVWEPVLEHKSEEEEAVERWLGTSHQPHSPSLVILGGGGRRFGSEAESEKKQWGWGKLV